MQKEHHAVDQLKLAVVKVPKVIDLIKLHTPISHIHSYRKSQG